MSWQGSGSSWRPTAVLRLRALPAAVIMLAGALAGPAAAEEPCNPIIDGTYCATNGPKYRGSAAPSSRRGMTAMDDYSRLVPSSAMGGAPGTLIGIGAQGDRSCFGLLRRSSCN